MVENKFNYLYVLEFSYPAIYEIELTKEDKECTTCEILEKRGLKGSNCDFMYSKNKLELSTIKE